MTEEPLQLGEGGRLFGILTEPAMPPHDADNRPLFLFLNAGLTHRVGPYRLHVSLSRALAGMGFRSMRVDLSGKGDSARRTDLSGARSVAADYQQIVEAIESRLGSVRIVLAGLCSGAHDAIRLAIRDERVVGMFLLDPVCIVKSGFKTHAVTSKYKDAKRYVVSLRGRLGLAGEVPDEGNADAETTDVLALRDLPTTEQLRAAFAKIVARQGRSLSVFTQYAAAYYSKTGQLGRTLEVDGYDRCCSELFWPDADHTFTLEVCRRRLEKQFSTWAAGFATTRGAVLPA